MTAHRSAAPVQETLLPASPPSPGTPSPSGPSLRSVPSSSDREKLTVSDKQLGSEWRRWLEDYRQATGRNARGSRPARTAFRARRREGWTLDDLMFATRGCHGTNFCRERGYDVPETILRASKVEKYVLRGRGELANGNGVGTASKLTADLAHLDELKASLA